MKLRISSAWWLALLFSGACSQSDATRAAEGAGGASGDAKAGPLSWGPALRISVGTDKVSAPEMAADLDGNVMAIWLQGGDVAFQVYASLLTTRGWHTPVVLNPDAAGDMPALQPRIASDGQGHFFAVWSQAWKIGDDNRLGVYARRYVSGDGWGPLTTLTSGDDGGSATGALDLAADGQGNATVVWAGSDALWSHLTIHAARYDFATGWLPGQIISVDGTQSATPPSVAMDARGNAMVVWGQSAGDEHAAKGAHAAHYIVGSGWQAPIALEPAAIAETRSSAVARVGFDSAGDAIAIWSHSAYSGITVNRWSASTGWAGASDIPGLGTNGVDEDVRLAIGRQGNALALWNHQGSLLVSRNVAGAWSAAETIESGPAESGRISAGPEGVGLAVWARHADGGDIVTSSRFLPDAGWSGPSLVGQSHQASDPRIVVDEAGMATALWRQEQGLFAARAFIGR